MVKIMVQNKVYKCGQNYDQYEVIHHPNQCQCQK